MQDFEYVGDDIGELEARLEALYGVTGLQFGKAPKTHHYALSAYGSDDFKIIRTAYGVPIVGKDKNFEDFYVATSWSRGKSVLMNRHSEVAVSNGMCAMCPTHLDYVEHTADAEGTHIKISRGRLHEYFGRMLGRPFSAKEGLQFSFAPFASRLNAQWLDYVAFFNRAARSGTLSPIGSTALEEYGCSLLLEQLPHNRSDWFSKESSLHPRLIREAQGYIEREAHRPVTVSDIAAHVGCSIRNLQYCFREYLGTTPHAALAAARMELAYRALAEANIGETVTAIAERLGFLNLGRFSAAFRARYGERPIRVLGRERRWGGDVRA